MKNIKNHNKLTDTEISFRGILGQMDTHFQVVDIMEKNANISIHNLKGVLNEMYSHPNHKLLAEHYVDHAYEAISNKQHYGLKAIPSTEVFNFLNPNKDVFDKDIETRWDNFIITQVSARALHELYDMFPKACLIKYTDDQTVIDLGLDFTGKAIVRIDQRFDVSGEFNLYGAIYDDREINPLYPLLGSAKHTVKEFVANLDLNLDDNFQYAKNKMLTGEVIHAIDELFTYPVNTNDYRLEELIEKERNYFVDFLSKAIGQGVDPKIIASMTSEKAELLVGALPVSSIEAQVEAKVLLQFNQDVVSRIIDIVPQEYKENGAELENVFRLIKSKNETTMYQKDILEKAHVDDTLVTYGQKVRIDSIEDVGNQRRYYLNTPVVVSGKEYTRDYVTLAEVQRVFTAATKESKISEDVMVMVDKFQGELVADPKGKVEGKVLVGVGKSKSM